MWTYLSYGPFATFSEYKAWLEKMTAGSDPCFYSIIDLSGHAVGVAAYLRIDAPNGVIEVGHLGFSPLLQKTIAATEAMHLMMRHAFEAGYRRYEWKCDSLNVPSRNAATRYGFQFEGIFRQAAVYKGRTRDTAWFSITDLEWPAIHAAFVGWLDPQNFDSSGRQKRKLESFRG